MNDIGAMFAYWIVLRIIGAVLVGLALGAVAGALIGWWLV